LIPSLYILPEGKREGIVLNLAELRLYYYPPGSASVRTYPVSIGDVDWRTPLGTTNITAKVKDPPWNPPPSIIREHVAEGDELPTFVPGGSPDNPLGKYALYLAQKGYRIHGTDERRAFGIGMRVSHGCIRLYPEDIELLFNDVRVGMQVRIVDQPIKIGWRGDQLFLEVHRPLLPEEERGQREPNVEELINLVSAAVSEYDRIDVAEVRRAFISGDGIPVPIAVRSF
jgi:L,D-transpeptidase ErfK/SrfK